MTAKATQNLSAFNLDFQGLTVRSIAVNGQPATWSRNGGELTVRPKAVLARGGTFTVTVTYDGVPQTIGDPLLGISGFIHTDDGAIVAGQPDVAATWFPSNDHPRDAATFELSIAGSDRDRGDLQRRPARQDTASGWTTWNWRAAEPMATYLATLAVGQFDVSQYQADGIRFWDALDPDLYDMPTILDPYDPDPRRSVRSRRARWPASRRSSTSSRASPATRTRSRRPAASSTTSRSCSSRSRRRPGRSTPRCSSSSTRSNGDLVVVHELAHQWFGDDLRLNRWQDIWLNEGFATYTEWLWLEREGLITVQEIFDIIAAIPADDEYWDVRPGTPGRPTCSTSRRSTSERASPCTPCAWRSATRSSSGSSTSGRRRSRATP